MPVRIKNDSDCFDCNDIPQPVIIHHPKNGIIIDFNQAAKKLFGFSQNDKKKLKIETIHPGSVTTTLPSKKVFQHLGSQLHRTKKGKDLSLTVVRKAIQLDGQQYCADFFENSGGNVFKESFINNSLDAVIGTDKRGLIIEWNPAAEKIFGWKKKEITGKDFLILISDQSKKEYTQRLTRLKNSRAKANGWIELSTVHKSKEVFSSELSITPIIENGKEIRYYVLRDITEKKKTQEYLKQSEIYLKRAQAIASVGSWEMSGRFQENYWSDEFYRIHGLEPQSVKPSTRLRLEMVYAKDRVKLEEAIEGAFRDGKPYSIEKRIVLPNKTIRWVLSQGEASVDPVTGKKKVFGTLLDITSRKNEEQLSIQLKENDERLLSIIKNIPRGVVYQYALNKQGKVDHFTFISEGANELFELTPQYIVANPNSLDNLVHPDDLASLKEKNNEARKRNSLFEFEYRIITPSGLTRWMHTRSLPKEDVHKQILWDAITLDITERKQLEETTRESEERFRSLVNDINIGILLQGPKAEIFLSNQAALDMLGLTEDQLLGRTSYDPVWALTRADGTDFPLEELPVPQAIKRKIPVRDIIMGITRPTKKDRIWLSVDAIPRVDKKGNVINVIATFSDITQRKQQQEELFQSKKYFESLINSQSSYLIRTDMAGNYSFVNDKFNEAFNYYNQNLIGTNSLNTIVPEDHSLCHQAATECFAHPGKVVPVRLRKPKKNGQGFYWTEWEFVALHNEKGEPSGIQAVGLDASDRILSQLELQKTTSRFMMAKQTAQLGIWEWDLTTNELIWDDIVFEMLGFDKNKGITLEALSDALHPDDLKTINKIIGELTPSNNSMSIVFRIIRPRDKQMRYIRVYSIAEFDSAERITKITGIDYDTTDQEVAIEAIRESEKRFRSLADSAPVFIWMAGIDKHCTYVNKGWVDFTGSTLEQVVGKGWMENMHPEDFDQCLKLYNNSFDQHMPFKMEYRLRRKDGHYRWLLDTGNPRFLENNEFVGYIGTCFDITERKEAEEKLIQSEKRFNSFMKNTPILNWITDDEGRMSYFNEAYHTRFNLNPEETVGKSVYDLFPEDIAQQFFTNIEWVAKSGKVLQTIETAPGINQTLDEFLVYKFPLGDGQIGGVAVDVTKQRQAEKDLVRSLEEKDLLIKEIHHRVKNNLQLISSILYIKMTGMQQSEIKSFLEDTRQKIRSIALIHERLLQTGSVNEVEIADYLGKLIIDLQMSNRRQDLQVDFEYNIEPEKINLDTAIYCGLIINELITNSFKHAFVNREKGTIRVFLQRLGDQHQLIIGDNGSSLPEKIIPGYTGSFGMQMLDIFVKQLNGKMEINRTGGTTFNIIFDRMDTKKRDGA